MSPVQPFYSDRLYALSNKEVDHEEGFFMDAMGSVPCPLDTWVGLWTASIL